MSACFDQALLKTLLARCVRDAGIETLTLPEGARLRRLGNVRFAINYGDTTWQVPAPDGARFLLGNREVGPADVAAWVEAR
jgi:beta-galactosidase